VGGFAAVMSIDEMVDLTNIGTLFAFVLVCVGIIVLRYKDPTRPRPFRVPFGAWFLPTLGAISCLFLMVYLPPASWWRFVGWLALGLSVYLSYGYSRSEVGRKEQRPFKTPLGLKLAAIGFLLVAVGLFVIPHTLSLKELLEQIAEGSREGKRATFAFASIAIGLVAGIIGVMVGMKKTEANEKNT
jgi:APA family basic amino acid/polyamine antiporter